MISSRRSGISSRRSRISSRRSRISRRYGSCVDLLVLGSHVQQCAAWPKAQGMGVVKAWALSKFSRRRSVRLPMAVCGVLGGLGQSGSKILDFLHAIAGGPQRFTTVTMRSQSNGCKVRSSS